MDSEDLYVNLTSLGLRHCCVEYMQLYLNPMKCLLLSSLLPSPLFICPSCLNYRHFDCCCMQSSVLHSQPKSTVGTPAYIAPEVLLKKEYDGKVYLFSLYSYSEQMVSCVIIWSSGVVDGFKYS